MGLFDKFAKIGESKAWKVGAKIVKVPGKAAIKGGWWVVKKVAVDPAKRKILDMSLVQKAGKLAEVKQRLAAQQCAQCGKKLRHKTGPVDVNVHFCSEKCGVAAFAAWSLMEKEEQTPREADPDGWNDLHFPCCGKNKKGGIHALDCEKFPGKEEKPKWW